MTNELEFKLETAACLWEALLDLRQKGLRPVPPMSLESEANPDAPPIARAVVEWLEGSGTCDVRLTVIGWTDECEAEWKKVAADFTGCFDWDFVPEFLERKLEQVLDLDD